MIKRLKHLSQEKGLRELGLLKKILGDLTSVLKYLLGGRKDEGPRLCSGEDTVGTRKTTQFHLNTRTYIFPVRGQTLEQVAQRRCSLHP